MSNNDKDLGLPRLPKVSGYQQEMWTVPKDAIYAAINAIQLALGYMPQIQTDVPQWQKTVERDVEQMQHAVAALRKLGADTAIQPKKSNVVHEDYI